MTQRDWIESVVREFERPLTLYATRLLGDVDRARDVVQDAFLKLWQADRARIEGHVARWLYTVCRNRVVDIRRKERRMTTVDHEHAAMPPAADAEPDASGDPILGMVRGLPERQQEAVRLRFQGGLSYREIAEVMDTTANNVGVLLHTAIKSIRQQVSGTAGDAGVEVTR